MANITDTNRLVAESIYTFIKMIVRVEQELIDCLVFNANFSSISAILWHN
jgi:hypothetical protein